MVDIALILVTLKMFIDFRNCVCVCVRIDVIKKLYECTKEKTDLCMIYMYGPR